MKWLICLLSACGASDPPPTIAPAPTEAAPLPITPPAEPAPTALPPGIDAILADPRAALESTPPGFRIVALSNLAEGCAHLWLGGELAQARALECAEIAVDAALAPQLAGDRPDALGDDGLYLTHLAIALAARRRAGGDDRHDALHRRIAAHLAARSLSDPLAHAPSFAGEAARWPADQAATLYALHRFDQLHDAAISDAPIAAWQEVMAERGLDPETGLHRSELTGAKARAALPRGCALSWTVRYMAAFAPDDARALWDRYRALYRVEAAGLVGFREWPPGIDAPADLDSGPIVQGVGVAATAFALGASRAVGDEATHAELAATASLMRAVVALEGGELAEVARSALGEAIALNGAAVVAW